MNFKLAFLIIQLAIIFPTSSTRALASIFENTEGVYKIISCKNDATNPSPWDLTLCDNTELTVHPGAFGTSFYFSRTVDNEVRVRNFDLPSNMASRPNGKYIEKGNYFAAFTNDDKGSGEIFVMRKNNISQYHLSMHRRSDLFKTFDMFEIELEKTADHSEPPPEVIKTKTSKKLLID